MNFWVVAMFWWPMHGAPDPQQTPPQDFSRFSIPGPVIFYDSAGTCMQDIPKRRENLTLPDALSGHGMNGFTCIRLQMAEVSQQPPIAP
jgi:hypothetical protein